ncbi:helix-turn-helix domain-containing protein [Streptomyces sp. NPDC091217]|uniref:helix-turn-helix domain-containing protein n=1 Tax=Streptomyces sp. NPDC091217 TaxID=3365975 RepID=UPI0038159745
MSTRRSRQRPKATQRLSHTAQAPVADALPTTPEDARAKAVRQLVEPGEERVRLAAELERLDARLRPLILEAVSAGVPYRRLAELTGISRATVARWGKSAEQ